MEKGDQDLNKKTLCDLKIQAKKMGLSGYSKLKKAELIMLIQNDMRSRRSPTPKISNPNKDEVSDETVDGKWKALGQMSVLPVEIIDKIYKMLSPQHKARFLQTNKLMKNILGDKVPEKEKKLYLQRKEGKDLFQNLFEITNQDANRFLIPYEGTVPFWGEIPWDAPLDEDYSTVIVPKKIVNLIEVEENIKNGIIKPIKGKLDTIPKLINYVNSAAFSKMKGRMRINKNNYKTNDQTNLEYINTLLTDDIKEKLIEFYLNLLERIEKRLP
jgi:hypothetical protein